MSDYSEQDLKNAAEFREGIHREALAIVRKALPHVTEVVDRHPVEDYFQKHWDYPGKWYTIVSIPYGCKSRRALVDELVRDTLSGAAPQSEAAYASKFRKVPHSNVTAEPTEAAVQGDDPFYRLIADYPDLVLDYCIIQNERYCGYESHRRALKAAFLRLGGEWRGEPERAAGKRLDAAELFASEERQGRLNYRRAFLCPPHGTCYTDMDFARVNRSLFPEGTSELEVYEWSTDWSDYFDDGHEWWGALCLTVYDKRAERFVVMMASATD